MEGQEAGDSEERGRERRGGRRHRLGLAVILHPLAAPEDRLTDGFGVLDAECLGPSRGCRGLDSAAVDLACNRLDFALLMGTAHVFGGGGGGGGGA